MSSHLRHTPECFSRRCRSRSNIRRTFPKGTKECYRDSFCHSDCGIFGGVLFMGRHDNGTHMVSILKVESRCHPSQPPTWASRPDDHKLLAPKQSQPARMGVPFGGPSSHALDSLVSRGSPGNDDIQHCAVSPPHECGQYEPCRTYDERLKPCFPRQAGCLSYVGFLRAGQELLLKLSLACGIKSRQ